VKSVVNGETILFAGGHYELNSTTGEVSKYYFAGASRIAVRKYIVPQTTTLTYLVGDHLGSTSLAVDASTGDVVQTRYKPWGEVRFTTANATLPTRYTFTGQYSYVSDDATDLGNAGFGLMFYNARWYDPYLNRFTQPDSIVPLASQGTQAWDRYAYANNNPVRYKDPSGHRCVEGDYDGSCQSVETQMSIDYVLESKRSDFEKKALMNLLRAGKIGLHIFDYIVLNDIKIGFHWHLYAGAYWKDKENALYLNRDPNTTSPDDPFVLNLIAHEVTHLEQGSTWALTKAGELEAWQVGFKVQSYFSPLTEGTPEDRIVNDLEIWDTDTFTDLVHEYNQNASGGWLYNFFFDLLPDYPIGIMI